MAQAVCFGGPIDGYAFEADPEAKSVTIAYPYVPPSWSPQIAEVHLHVYRRLDATHFGYSSSSVQQDRAGS